MLRVEFSDEIRFSEVPAFRGAIIDKVGRGHVLFHHHLEEGAYLHQYPLIQYKAVHKHPTLLCIEAGVDEAHRFFMAPSWGVVIGNRDLEMKVSRLDMKEHRLQVVGGTFNYRIRNWLALNPDNYREYRSTPHLAARVEMLERILTGNILSFAKGLDWFLEQEVRVHIREIEGTHILPYKGVPLTAFNVTFDTNVYLPAYIGLGKGASTGFGVISPVKESNGNENER